MNAAQYDSFSGPIEIRSLPTPKILPSTPDSILIQVKATGVCRSDWHGWKGHDSDIKDHGLPFTPGHEFSGIVVQIGTNVKKCKVGQKVVVPFILSCGSCRECNIHLRNKPTVCENQMQPGFTLQGSFAEYIRIPRADRNVCVLPDDGSIDFIEAAALGCRFTTAYRAVLQQGGWRNCVKNVVSAVGEKEKPVCAVFGCGGLGLSTIMIAKAVIKMEGGENDDFQIIAIDVSLQALKKARELGATDLIDASKGGDNHDYVRAKVFELTQSKGADLSIDAAGFPSTCENAVHCTRRAGRMIQVGLPIDNEQRHPIIPMGSVAGKEIEIIGSHGFAAMYMPKILNMVSKKVLDPKQLVQKEVSLREGAKAIENMDFGSPLGITMVTRFHEHVSRL